MKRKTFVVTIIFFLSTVIQVVSNIVLTRLFGTAFDYVHFLAAVTIPTIIVSVIYGTLNDALLPLYGEKLIKEKDNSDDFFFTQLTTFTLLSMVITFVVDRLSPPLLENFYGSSGLFMTLLVDMFKIMNLAIPFAVFATILGMRLYAHKQYTAFPVAQMIGSIVNLVLVVLLYNKLGAYGMVYAFVISILIQVVFIFPKKIQFKFGNIAPALALWFPLVVGITALKSDSLIIRTFSAQLPQSFIVYHNLISKVCSLSAGLITIGIQVLFLPNIIEKLAQKDYLKTKKLVNKVKLITVGLSIFLIIAIYFIAPFLIKLLFVGGKFTLDDYNTAIDLLPYYLVPVFGWGIVSVFLQPLYALKKHLSVGIINLICFGIGWYLAVNISQSSPSLAISVALSVLLVGSSFGAELVWQLNLNKLIKQ